MESGWICVVISKSLADKGLEALEKEMRQLAGKSFISVRLKDDDFDGDRYSFLNCTKDIDMAKFRSCINVVTVLESYDNLTYLSDNEVSEFLEIEDICKIRRGDMVSVGGDGYYSGLHGVVMNSSDSMSEVFFRFHTVLRQEWLDNDDLEVHGNLFNKLKLPVHTKFPVGGSDGSSGESDR